MKRTLLILLACAALGMPCVHAVGDTTDGRAHTELATAEASAQGGVGHMMLIAGESDIVFGVYSITGQLLRTVKVAAGSRVTIEMPKGFYIVRCGNRGSRKVVVR